MVTTNRVVSFVVAFVVAVPVMLMVFRESGELTRAGWAKSLVFGGSIAVIVAIAFGRSRR
ncbi:hypothetical protein NX794_04785 [Streptomyces sp. LP11]|uniref:Integral membrane protein n=1 Tax=Streptomyces pyxinicus TaxID=2970331 RepID=A0ABT2AWB9_9ACTN|nr:hypothetical protein [Streptomyces sp. LP11]MCS0600550.1 hypothetical protein [Streptomyces sp. LP11]